MGKQINIFNQYAYNVCFSFKFHDSYDIKRVLDIQAEFLSGTDMEQFKI